MGSNPAERAVEKAKRVELHQSKLSPYPMTVHLAVEDQTIRRRTIDGENCFPVPAVALGECESLSVRINGCAIAGE